MSGGDKNVVGSMLYDPKVQRRSEDHHRQNRRSSIPFADRKPAVRFIRAVDSLKGSASGTHGPQAKNSNKPILKKTEHPILVDSSHSHNTTSTFGGGSFSGSTNDDLDTCRFKTEFIMDRVSRTERLARGALDVLTFPTSTLRLDALSRFQGCMAIGMSVIDHYTLTKFKQHQEKKVPSPELEFALEICDDLAFAAMNLLDASKKLLRITQNRYNEWDVLLKRSSEFQVDHSRLRYPIYTHRKMPESVSIFEDSFEDPQNNNIIDGYMRVSRQFPDGMVLLFCDLTAEDESGEQVPQKASNGSLIEPVEPISFNESSDKTQLEVIKYVVTHGKDLIVYSDAWMNHAMEALLDKELDETSQMIQRKIAELQYDEYYDPLCALDFKAALGELISRKAELLNTAEHIVIHCKWMVKFSNFFRTFAKRRIRGQGCCTSCWSCSGGDRMKSRLLKQLGPISHEEVTILMPLTLDVYQDVYAKLHHYVPVEEGPPIIFRPGESISSHNSTASRVNSVTSIAHYPTAGGN